MTSFVRAGAVALAALALGSTGALAQRVPPVDVGLIETIDNVRGYISVLGLGTAPTFAQYDFNNVIYQGAAAPGTALFTTLNGFNPAGISLYTQVGSGSIHNITAAQVAAAGVTAANVFDVGATFAALYAAGDFVGLPLGDAVTINSNKISISTFPTNLTVGVGGGNFGEGVQNIYINAIPGSGGLADPAIVTLAAAAVPAPAGLAVIAGGVALLGLRRRRA